MRATGYMLMLATAAQAVVVAASSSNDNGSDARLVVEGTHEHYELDGMAIDNEGLVRGGSGPGGNDVRTMIDGDLDEGSNEIMREVLRANHVLMANANTYCVDFETPCDCSLAAPFSIEEHAPNASRMDVNAMRKAMQLRGGGTMECGWSSATSSESPLGVCRAGSTTHTDEMLTFAAASMVNGGGEQRRRSGPTQMSFRECLMSRQEEVTMEHVEKVMMLIGDMDSDGGHQRTIETLNTL